jgi:hypothetical protein
MIRWLKRQGALWMPPVATGCAGPGATRRALLSYIALPFLSRDRSGDRLHSNRREAVIIAETIAGFGYSVDVIDWRSRYPVRNGRYDLLFGFGGPYVRTFRTPCASKRIWYATGAEQSFQAVAEATRLRAFRDRHGLSLRPRRMPERFWTEAEAMSDGMVVVGNGWTASTYRPLNPRLHTVLPTSNARWNPSDLAHDWQRRRNGFLWFGSVGAVHKGLDLCYDALPLLGSGVRLHTCGPVTDEGDFLAAYGGAPPAGTTHHGFVDVAGEPLRRILADCAFAVLPSCSEGCATSVLACMQAGLIPIVTAETGIDLDLGIPIAEATPAGVAAAMRQALLMDEQEWLRRSTLVAARVREQHSHDAFAAGFRQALGAVL